MTQVDFDRAFEDFVAPVTEFVATHTPACRVFWLKSDVPEVENVLALAPEEVTSYLRSFLAQGSFATVRVISENGEHHLDITLWEEWGGEFAVPRFIATEGRILVERVWPGLENWSG